MDSWAFFDSPDGARGTLVLCVNTGVLVVLGRELVHVFTYRPETLQGLFFYDTGWDSSKKVGKKVRP